MTAGAAPARLGNVLCAIIVTRSGHGGVMNRRLVCFSVPMTAALSAARYVPSGRHFALLLLSDARGVEAAVIGDLG